LIEVRYKGRLGNNLFQYCLGRILAEELGFALKAVPIPAFPNTAQRVSGEIHEGPEEVFKGPQLIPLETILADQSPRRIILDGWFQRYEYYRPRREKIQEWLTFDPTIRVPEAAPDIIVNVRRTDYVQAGWALPFSYYHEAIETVLPQGGEVWIVTDDRRDPFFRKFARWEPIFFSGTAPEQLLFMARAPRLVMSQSTFSWWPTFLGDVQQVICPIPGFGVWSKTDQAKDPGCNDTNLIEQDRFICIRCADSYRPTRLEASYQYIRLMMRRRMIQRAIKSASRWLNLSPTMSPT
jgi:hypothetical protein